MKTIFFKPGFEFIFSLGLMAILGLPPLLMAQNNKDMDIKIQNGDTVVNGKSIKSLSTADRQSALTTITHISSVTTKDTSGGLNRSALHNGRPMITQSTMARDSLGNVIAMRTRKPNQALRRQRMDMDNTARMRNRLGSGPGMRFDSKNTQNFDYISTDNEGISTHVSYHLSEVSDDELKKMPYVEGPKFEIKDLNLVPEFSTGKTLLMFNLLSKAPAEVQLTDGEGKLIWNEKALGGVFKKTFPLGLNGVYYLQIKQASSIALKRIMKMD